jgi:NAD(P)-dependent dehydrogenase (short-subunit alcohol dehydrogenase family)
MKKSPVRAERVLNVHADLDGRHVFVSGASTGLGRHFVRLFASHGARVTVAARREHLVDTLVDEITGLGQIAYGATMDVTDPQSVADAVARSGRQFGTIHVLINNAGTTSVAPVLDQTTLQWDSVINTNLRGSFIVATEVARSMREASTGGSIINVASILGIRQVASVAPYGVSKAGLIQLTQLMALELARYSIRVNAIAPGYIDTELNHDFWQTEAGLALIRRIPQRRLGQPADLDGPLLLLASDASRFMTGSVLAVDGGHLVSGL